MTSLLLTENFATVEEDSLLRWAEAYGVNGDLRSRYAVYDMIMADTPFSRGALNLQVVQSRQCAARRSSTISLR